MGLGPTNREEGAWQLLQNQTSVVPELHSPRLLGRISSTVAPSEAMAKDMTLLWGSGSPPCWKVQIALEEKKLQGYNSVMLSFQKMEHKSQQVLDINPRGQVGWLCPQRACSAFTRSTLT